LGSDQNSSVSTQRGNKGAYRKFSSFGQSSFLMADKENLFRMCRNGETENVRMALAWGEDFTGFEEFGFSTITLAASGGHLDVVAVLLDQGGIDVNSTDQWGRTALHPAANQGHLAVMELLFLQPGIEVNQANVDGNTALHGAAAGGHLAVIELLLNQPGIEVNQADNGGETALHKPERLEILLEARQTRKERNRQQQRQVSKVLLEGLYDEGSPLSMLRGVCHDVMGEIIWKQMLLSKWQVFPEDQ